MRVNRLSEVFKHLSYTLLSDYCIGNCQSDTSLVDSLPIIICSGKRATAVAKELTDKGFCSTKNYVLYGLKLHALAYHRPEHLPFPESIVLTPTSENDLNAYKQNWNNIDDRNFYGDKIYNDAEFFKNTRKNNNSIMLTPIKEVKGMPENLNKEIALTMTSFQRLSQGLGNLLNLCLIGLLKKQIFKERQRFILLMACWYMSSVVSQQLLYF